MTNESATSGRPPAVDRATFQAELAQLRACSTRSKAAGSSSPTTSCGSPARPRPSSARAARGARPSWPLGIRSSYWTVSKLTVITSARRHLTTERGLCDCPG
jgi:hypothetical protein